MSDRRTEERLEAMLALLREGPGHLDEITRARVAMRLEAALAAPVAAPSPAMRRRWRHPAVAVGLGIGLAAAVITVVATRTREPAPPAMTTVVDPPAATAPPAATTPAPLASAAGTPAAAGRSAAAPIQVAVGESAQLSLDGAAITIYGPGRLSPMKDGAAVEAIGIVVDRSHGEAPWSLRYHGVEIVTTNATFAAVGHTKVRVTVIQGELVMRCPSGPRTVRAGTSAPSATCEDLGEPLAPRPTTSPDPPLERFQSSAPAPKAESQTALEPELEPQPQPQPPTEDPYTVAESAMRRGDPEVAREALLAVVGAAPDSLEAATALLDLARLAVRRGDPDAAIGYMDQLDRHPRRAALAAPVARLRETLRPRPR